MHKKLYSNKLKFYEVLYNWIISTIVFYVWFKLNLTFQIFDTISTALISICKYHYILSLKYIVIFQ